jgi:hypothetical protein
MSPQNLETLPICEKCWLDENTVWEPEGVDEDGNIVSRLARIGLPEDLQPGKVHICCMCADLTIVGLFVERDPESVPYVSETIELDDWDL